MAWRKEARVRESKKKWASWPRSILVVPFLLATLSGCSEGNSHILRPQGSDRSVASQPPKSSPASVASSGAEVSGSSASQQPPVTPAIAQTPAANPPPQPGIFTPHESATDLDARFRELHRLAAERYAGIDSYIVRLRRREHVNGKDKPEEL